MANNKNTELDEGFEEVTSVSLDAGFEEVSIEPLKKKDTPQPLNNGSAKSNVSQSNSNSQSSTSNSNSVSPLINNGVVPDFRNQEIKGVTNTPKSNAFKKDEVFNPLTNSFISQDERKENIKQAKENPRQDKKTEQNSNPYAVDVTDKSKDNSKTQTDKNAQTQNDVDTGKLEENDITSYKGASNLYNKKAKEITGKDGAQALVDYGKVIGVDDDLFTRLDDGDKGIYQNQEQLKNLYEQRDILSNSDEQTQKSHLAEVNKAISEIEKTNAQSYLKRNSEIDSQILGLQKQLNNGTKVNTVSTGSGTNVGQDGLEYGATKQEVVNLSDDEKSTIKSQIQSLQKRKEAFLKDASNPQEVYQDLLPKVKMYEDKNIIPKDASVIDKLKIYYGIKLTQLNELKKKEESDGNSFLFQANPILKAAGIDTKRIGKELIKSISQRIPGIDDRNIKAINDIELELDSIAPIIAINADPNAKRNGVVKTFVNKVADDLSQTTGFSQTSQQKASSIGNAMQGAGVELSDDRKQLLETQMQNKDIGQREEKNATSLGSTTAFMVDFGGTSVLAGGILNGVSKGLKLAKLALSPKAVALLGMAETAINETRIGRLAVNVVDEGLKYEITGDINKVLKENSNFSQGASGAIGSKLGEKTIEKLASILGKNAGGFLTLVFDTLGRTGVELFEETAQNTDQLMTEITGKNNFISGAIDLFKDSEKGKAFTDGLKQQYGNIDDDVDFVLQIAAMSTAFNIGKFGKYFKDLALKKRNELSPTDREKYDVIIHGMQDEVKDVEDKAVDEVAKLDGKKKEEVVAIINNKIGTAETQNSSTVTQVKTDIANKISKGEKLTNEEQDYYDVAKEDIDKLVAGSDTKVTVSKAVIEIGGKMYEGNNHAEAILKAKADGQDISQVDRQAQGKFKLSDGTIIDRAESKSRFGQDRSELMIPQDENAKEANKEYAKITRKPLSKIAEKIKLDENKVTPIKPINTGQEQNNIGGVQQTPENNQVFQQGDGQNVSNENEVAKVEEKVENENNPKVLSTKSEEITPKKLIEVDRNVDRKSDGTEYTKEEKKYVDENVVIKSGILSPNDWETKDGVVKVERININIEDVPFIYKVSKNNERVLTTTDYGKALQYTSDYLLSKQQTPTTKAEPQETETSTVNTVSEQPQEVPKVETTEKVAKYDDAEIKDFAKNSKFKTNPSNTHQYFNINKDKQIRITKNNKTGIGKGYRVTLHSISEDGISYNSNSESNEFATSLADAKNVAGKLYFEEIRKDVNDNIDIPTPTEKQNEVVASDKKVSADEISVIAEKEVEREINHIVKTTSEKRAGLVEKNKLLKKQKETLLADLRKASEILLEQAGNNNDKVREMMKQTNKEMFLPETLTDETIAQLKELGIIVSTEKAKYNSELDKLKIDIIEDGSIKIPQRGIFDVIEMIEKEFPTEIRDTQYKQSTTPPKVSKSRYYTIAQDYSSVDIPKKKFENAKDNLETAKKSGNKKLIEVMQENFNEAKAIYDIAKDLDYPELNIQKEVQKSKPLQEFSDATDITNSGINKRDIYDAYKVFNKAIPTDVNKSTIEDVIATVFANDLRKQEKSIADKQNELAKKKSEVQIILDKYKLKNGLGYKKVTTNSAVFELNRALRDLAQIEYEVGFLKDNSKEINKLLSGDANLQSTDKNFTPISKSKFNELLDKLKKAFPNVKVELFGKNDFENAKKELEANGIKIQDIKTKDGTIYGFKTPDGKVFLNSDNLNANTPIHEYGHIWQSVFPQGFARGIELLKLSPQGQALIREIQKNPAYKGKSLAEIHAEALVTAIGNKGEQTFKGNPSALKRFQEWLTDFFKTIGDKLGLDTLSADDKLDMFTKKVVGELLGGKVLSKEVGNGNLDFQVKDGLKEFVEDAKKEGYTKQETIDYVKDNNPEINEQDVIDTWDAVNENSNIPPTIDVETETISSDGKSVDKTLLKKRIYDNANQTEKERQEIEQKYGLKRDKIPYEEAKRIAKNIVDIYGLDNAIKKVRNGDIANGVATEVYYLKFKDLDKEQKEAKTEEEQIKIIGEKANLASEWSNVTTDKAQFISQLGSIYKEDNGLLFNADIQKEEYKRINNGEISDEVAKKFDELEKELKASNKKIDQLESEQKKIEEKYKESVSKSDADIAIAEAYEKGKKDGSIGKEAKKYTKKAKEVADKFRELKKKPFEFDDGNGNKVILTENSLVSLNDIIEAGAKIIEASGKIADGINHVINEVKDTDWYKNMSPNKRSEFENKIEEQFGEKKSEVEKKEKRFSIANSRVKEIVERRRSENKETTIDDVVEELKRDFPDKTEREIRDAITNYGVIKESSNEPDDVTVRKIKRMGRYLSALEDIENGIRPKRSGQQRDTTDPEERAKLREIREELKKLPLSDADLSQKLKTAQDAIETRLNNEIEDLQREIDTGEKRIRTSNNIQTTKDIEDLKAKRDAKKQERDDLFQSSKYDDVLQELKDIADKTGQKTITKTETKNGLISDLLQAHIEKGTEMKDVQKQMFDDLQAIFPDITQREVLDAIAKKGVFKADDKEKTDLQKKLSELKKQFNLQTKIEDAQKGIVASTKSKGADSPEVQAFKEELKQAREEAKNKYPNVSANELQKKIERVQKSIDNYKAKEANKDYFIEKKIQAEFHKDKVWREKYRELELLKLERAKVKAQFESEKDKIREKNLTLTEKIGENLGKLKRFDIFLDLFGMGRLALAAVARPITNPLREISKLALSYVVPSVMKKSIGNYRKGPMQSFRYLGKYYASYFAKKTYKDAISEFNKRSNFSLTNEDKKGKDRYTTLIGRILSAPEQAHGFMKAFAKLPQYNSTYEIAMENLSETIDPQTGKLYDITDPLVQRIAVKEAYREANADVFMDDSDLAKLNSKLWNGAMESESYIIQLIGIYGKQLEPIIKVPANFYGEVMSQMPFVGFARAIMEINRSGDIKNKNNGGYRGVINLTPEQAQNVQRKLTSQLVGFMGIAIGMMMYKSFGDDAEDELDAIEKWMHNTSFPIVMMGMELAKHLEREDKAKIAKIPFDEIIHETKSLPQYRVMRDISFTSDKTFKKLLAGLVTPSFLRRWALMQDNEKKRYPKTIQDYIAVNFPQVKIGDKVYIKGRKGVPYKKK